MHHCLRGDGRPWTDPLWLATGPSHPSPSKGSDVFSSWQHSCRPTATRSNHPLFCTGPTSQTNVLPESRRQSLGLSQALTLQVCQMATLRNLSAVKIKHYKTSKSCTTASVSYYRSARPVASRKCFNWTCIFIVKLYTTAGNHKNNFQHSSAQFQYYSCGSKF